MQGSRNHEELNLKGDISWGAEVQFENEALMAVRTANFIRYVSISVPVKIRKGNTHELS